MLRFDLLAFSPDELALGDYLTAAHSKKLVNHIHMVALYTVWYNFARINSAVRMSPAMAAGINDRLWEMGDLVMLVESFQAKGNS